MSDYDYLDIWEEEQDRIVGKRRERSSNMVGLELEDMELLATPPRPHDLDVNMVRQMTRPIQMERDEDQWPPREASSEENEGSPSIIPNLNGGDQLSARRPPPVRTVTKENEKCVGKVAYDPKNDPLAKYGSVGLEKENPPKTRKAQFSGKMTRDQRVAMMKEAEKGSTAVAGESRPVRQEPRVIKHKCKTPKAWEKLKK